MQTVYRPGKRSAPDVHFVQLERVSNQLMDWVTKGQRDSSCDRHVWQFGFNAQHLWRCASKSDHWVVCATRVHDPTFVMIEST